MVTSILVYIPAGKIADGIGRKPFVIATFLCFVLVSNCDNLRFKLHFDRVAFVIGGLREIGEPARKAMIVDFARESLRGRSVGLYYLLRILSITPAAAIAGMLWNISPEMPFILAGVIGMVGTVAFVATVEEWYAS